MKILMRDKAMQRTHKHFKQWMILSVCLLALCGVTIATLYWRYNAIQSEDRNRLNDLAKVLAVNFGLQLNAANSALMSIRNDLPPWTSMKKEKILINRRL